MKRTCSLLSLTLLLSLPAGLALAKPVGHLAPQKAATMSVKRADVHAAKQTSASVSSTLARPRARVDKSGTTPASLAKLNGTAKATKSTSAAPGKAKPCYAKPVQLLRVRGEQVEPREVSLTMCSGAPNPSALDSVSLLGRPRDVERPELAEIRAYRSLPIARGKLTAKNRAAHFQNPAFVTDHVMRLNPGLVVRLQKIAKHYPGRVIEIISGYRPDARETSRHHHGQALDLRVAGVRRERLRDYLRTFEDTGVGYYPNSFFVHMDVRDSKGYWVDRSGPGEPADYGPWPTAGKRIAQPAKRPADRTRENMLKGALADLDALRGPLASHSDKHTASTGALLGQNQLPRPSEQARAQQHQTREPQHEGDEMTQDEVKQAREEARKALEGL